MAWKNLSSSMLEITDHDSDRLIFDKLRDVVIVHCIPRELTAPRVIVELNDEDRRALADWLNASP